MANMAFTVLPRVTEGGLMIIVHPNKSPTDLEWDRYFEELVKHDPERLRSLVFTDGGAPNTPQRKRVNDWLRGRASICAVVTTNTFVRGVVTAFSWFNPKINAFAPGATDSAMHYLGIPEEDYVLVRRELQLLRKQFGTVQVESLAAAI
ncbi:MAG: hypothetical protein QM820_11440 [Minicystis sp.]